MSEILDIIAKETGHKSFKTHKMVYDSLNYPSIDYDDNSNIIWKNYGERIHHKMAVNLHDTLQDLPNDSEPLFKFFLDGSRRTYKVDDISISNQVFPVMAGQVGVGCCKRDKRRLSHQESYNHNVVTLPRQADSDGWDIELFCNRLVNKINDLNTLKKHNIRFDRILIYDFVKSEDIKLENKGIAKIQDYMIDLEKKMVAEIVNQDLLSNTSFLIKDGSIEYKKMKTGNYRELAKIRNNYRYVIGVSKSFNPERCQDNTGQINSRAIANLKLYHRTPVYMYQSEIVDSVDDPVYFAIWYLRIRDRKYTKSPYEGILKVEKILTTDNEINDGMDSEQVDYISINLIKERNPVCWGKDTRWANHLYPVYLTETYVKSQFISSNYFLNIF